MKKLAEFGLEKIPAEALLSIARQEFGNDGSGVAEETDTPGGHLPSVDMIKTLLQKTID